MKTKKKEKQVIATYCDGHVHIRLVPNKGELTHSRTGIISLKEIDCPIYDITNYKKFDFLNFVPEETIGKADAYYDKIKISLEEFEKKIIECGGVLIEDKVEFMKARGLK